VPAYIEKQSYNTSAKYQNEQEYAQQFLMLPGDAKKALPCVVYAVRGSGVWL